MNRFASRKFIVACLSLASTTWLVWSGHITDGVYSAVTIATVGSYLTANVLQRKQEGKPA